MSTLPSTSLTPVAYLNTLSAEHHTLYQYNLVNANSHFMGLIQTETVRIFCIGSNAVGAEIDNPAILPTQPFTPFTVQLELGVQ